MSDTQWENFSRKELTCRCGCGEMEMDDDFMGKIQSLRTRYGKPMRVTSGYRCSDHDASVSSSRTPGSGPHTTGQAIDFVVPLKDRPLIIALAIDFNILGWTQRDHGDNLQHGGLGLGRNFIHLDDLFEAEDRCRPSGWPA